MTLPMAWHSTVSSSGNTCRKRVQLRGADCPGGRGGCRSYGPNWRLKLPAYLLWAEKNTAPEKPSEYMAVMDALEVLAAPMVMLSVRADVDTSCRLYTERAYFVVAARVLVAMAPISVSLNASFHSVRLSTVAGKKDIVVVAYTAVDGKPAAEARRSTFREYWSVRDPPAVRTKRASFPMRYPPALPVVNTVLLAPVAENVAELSVT